MGELCDLQNLVQDYNAKFFGRLWQFRSGFTVTPWSFKAEEMQSLDLIYSNYTSLHIQIIQFKPLTSTFVIFDHRSITKGPSHWLNVVVYP